MTDRYVPRRPFAEDVARPDYLGREGNEVLRRPPVRRCDARTCVGAEEGLA
jgi:hypothetical protein